MSDAALTVALGSPNRHHTFDLGGQLEARGLLHRLYTMYPRSRVDTVPRARVRSFPWLLGASVVANRLGFDRSRARWNPLLIESYDAWLARRLEPCRVFHCLSSFGLRAHRRARETFGALTVCDRGCGHIGFQDRMLAEERERWGLPAQPIDPRTVERELEEYDTCDLVTVPSEFARRTFVAEGVDPAKLRCVPLGVDRSMFRPVPKEDDVFRVLYAGAISLEKGVPYLLQALAGLGLPRFEVWLAGPETAETAFILGRFPDGYRYLGLVPRGRLAWYYSQASVLVLPSVQDGFGMVMTQAMACGVPVVATTNTGADTLFADGEGGFHVPIRDPDALREAVLRLYRDPELRHHLAGQARVRVGDLGGWDSYGRAMEDVYRAGLASRAGG